MKLDFQAVNTRMADLVKRLSDDLKKPQCCDEWDTLIEKADQLLEEEKLFYVLLASHFASSATAWDFYSTLTWNGLLGSPISTVREISLAFFQQSRPIGDHRRNFRCMDSRGKANYTVEVLEAYKAAIKQPSYGSQIRFFETDGHPTFDTLYNRMRNIEPFRRRLPRFDHLERLARTHKFYIVSTVLRSRGYGWTPRRSYLLVAWRQATTQKDAIHIFVSKFPDEWNAVVGMQYRLPQRASLSAILTKLEIWTIDNVRAMLPRTLQNAPEYVFELESCLCNWQKRKKS